MLSAIGTRKTGVDESVAYSQKLDPRLTVSVTNDVCDRVRRLANRRGVKVSPMIRAWIEEILAREEARGINGES